MSRERERERKSGWRENEKPIAREEKQVGPSLSLLASIEVVPTIARHLPARMQVLNQRKPRAR
jgi:hypothetical protein